MAVNDGDILKVVQTIEMPDTVIGQNVFWERLDDPTPDNPSNAQIITALETKLDNIYAQVDANISDEYLFSQFTAERVEWDTEKWETVENVGGGNIAVAGESVSDALPHGVAATITAQTPRPQTRARKFVPGFVDASTNDSTWTAGVLTVLAQFATAWMAQQVVVGSAELTPVVVGQSGPSAGLVYLLVSAVVPAVAGYQRRRKPGVGS